MKKNQITFKIPIRHTHHGLLALFFFLSVLLFSTELSAQIAVRGTATTATATTNTVTINKPTGVVTGDIMIANIGAYLNATNTAATGTGWTAIAGTATDRGFATLLYRIADATDGSVSSYTFTTTTGSNPSTGAITAFSGVDSVTPFDGTQPTAWTTATAGSISNLTSITTVNPGAAVVQFGCASRITSQTTANFASWSLSSTELYDFGSNNVGNTVAVGAAWATRPTAGLTGAGGFTCSTNTTPRAMGGIMITLNPELQFRSVASGNWFATSTWQQSLDGVTWINAVSVPTEGDQSVTIRNGHVITSSANILSPDLTIDAGGTLTPGANTLLFYGDFVNNGTITSGSGAISISGSRLVQSIDGCSTTGAFGMFKTAGKATLTGNVSGGAFTINGLGGTLNLGSGLTHTFTGNWNRVNGTVEGGSSLLRIAGTAVNNTIGTFTPQTGTVEYNGSGQAAHVLTYNNLILSGNGTKTFATTPTVNGILSLEGTATVTVTTGALTYGTAATLQYNKPAAYTATTEEWPATFSGTGGVKIINTGTITLGAAKSITNNFSIATGASVNLGTFTHSAGTLTLGGLGTASGTASWGSTVSAATYKNSIYFGSTAGTTGTIGVTTDTRQTPTVTVTPVGTYTYTGAAQGPNAATNTGSSTSYTFTYVNVGGATYGPSVTAPTNAGSYNVYATVAANGNYLSASSAATAFTIGKVALTITAGNQTVAYGTAVATVTTAGTYTATGFVNSETSSVIGGTATYTTTYTTTTAAATAGVTITPVTTALTATNYTFSAANGSITVTTATPVVTPTVGTYTYTGASQGPNAATNTGTGTSYTFSYVNSGGTTYGPSATAPTNAGSYTVTVTVAANGNYTSASSSATAFTISKAALTITAANQTVSYGTAAATVTGAGTYTPTGFVNSETAAVIGGSVTYTTTYTATTAAATAGVTISPVITALTATNYSFTAVNGAITVSRASATLTVTATGPSKIYGTALTAGTSTTNFSVTGTLIGSEALTSVTLTPDAAGLSATTAANTAYVVTPSLATGTGGFLASNYNITYTAYNGTVAAKALTITANNQTNCSGTTFTFVGTEFTTSGLVNGNTVTGATLTSTGAPSSATAGTYSIIAGSAVGTGLTNYTIGYVNGTLTVNQSPDISNFSIGVTNPAAGGTSTVTISSTSLANGTYTVTYNLTGDNTATGSTASVTIVSGTGTFATSALATAGYTTITITAIRTAATCSSTISSGNSDTIVIATAVSTTITTTGTWQAPVGVTSVTVEAWGGGGAGGGATRTNPGTVNGGGGAGGAYAKGNVTVVPNTVYTVTVGGQKTATATSTAATNVGNPSWFSTVSTVYAQGGPGGAPANNGTGAGGTGSSSSSIGALSLVAGGSGAAGNTGGTGSTGGAGANGGGAGGTGVSGNNTGNTGTAPGGGGSGGRTTTNGTFNGGTGAAGQIKITYEQLTYKSQIVSTSLGSTNWCAGETRNVTVTIKNIGTATWTDGTGGTPTINIGAKWNTNGLIWNDYNVRTSANNLAPGETGTYTLSLTASNATAGPVYGTVLAAGTNNITFDLVYEGISWFGNNGGGVGPGNTVSTSVAQTILALPTVTSATGNTKTYTGIANATTVSAVASAGATIDWYDAVTGGTLLASGTLTYAPTGINAGTYTVYAQARNTSTQCTSAARTSATLTINKAVLTITASAQTISYGTAATTVTGNGTYTPTGFVNSETSSVIGGSATYTTTYTATTAAATAGVTITPIITSLTATNYSFSAANGAITVSKAPLSITASNASKCFGTVYTLGTSAFTLIGLQNSETIGSVTLTSAGAASNAAAGSYSIVPSAAIGGNFTAANYSITYTNGTLTVNALPTVTTSGNISICVGSSTTITASGAASYVWNNSLGTASSVTVSPSTTTTYTVTGTAANGCTNTADTIVTVNPIQAASVSIAASETSICSGTSVTFTATPTNGGTTPVYQWKVNGSSVGSNSATFTTSSLANGNVVSCVMTSNAPVCLSGSPATSNTVTMTVNPNLLASVSVGASATTICSGTSVTFTATPTNGGTTPSYQWKLNGSNVGTNSATYTSATLANGNTVSVVMTSNASPCLTGSPATSNSISMIVAPTTVGGTISGGGIRVCQGTTPADLTLSGYTGTIVRWEKSSNSSFTNPVAIASTSAVLTGAALGIVSDTVYVRAVVQSGLCSVAYSDTTTLTVLSTTWNGSQWSNGAPDSATTAFITANFTANSDLFACNLTVNNNASVLIPQGYNVVLSGALTVGSGSTFTLENETNLTQTVSASAAVNTGKIVVKEVTPPLMRQDYALFSSPVIGQQLQAFSPNTLSNRFYTYTPSSNVYSVVASPSATTFATGKGYLIRTPNNHPTTPTIWTASYEGTPFNGTLTLPVTSGTYNAVGNPYPSAIDADMFFDVNGLSEALYFYRKTNGTSSSAYATYTKAGGVSSSGVVGGNSSNDLKPNGIIAVGQGFIAKSASSTISFTNAMRVNSGAGVQLRRIVERHRVWLSMTNTTGFFSQTLVAYMTGATNGLDAGIDGRFFNDSQTAFTSLISGQEYSIQGRQLPFISSDVVALGFKTELAGTYSINLDAVDGMFLTSEVIYLKDKLTNTYTNMRSGSYTFSSTAGVFNDRFELRFAVPPTFYQDADGDGYGSAFNTISADTAPVGYVTNSSDCDDALATVNLNATEVLGNGIDDNCDGTVDEATYPASYLTGTSCGITMTNLSNTLFAYNLATYIPQNGPVQGYRFEVSDGQTARIYETVANSFNLLNLPGGALYGTTYSVRVSVKLGGFWRPYGTVCSVTTPAVPNSTSIVQPSCGSVMTDLSSSVFCNSVAGASGYRFRVRNGATIVGSYDSTVNRFSFMNIGISNFDYGVTYSIDVLLKFGTTWRPDTEYGSVCTITSPAAPPTSRVISPICGSTISSYWTSIFAQQITGAQGYRFEVSTGGQTYYYDSALSRFSLRNVVGLPLTANTTYSIRVAVLYNAVYYDYGSECSVTTAAVVSRVAETSSFEAGGSEDKPLVNEAGFTPISYPNPFVETFRIVMPEATGDLIHILIYDFAGKLIAKEDVFAADMESSQFGSSLQSGDYLLVISQGALIKSMHINKK